MNNSARITSIWLVAVALAAAAGGNVGALHSADTFDWLPAESQAADLGAEAMGGERIIPTVVQTTVPKTTADLAKFTRVYTIDLKKFSIRNDGTEA